MKRAIRSTRKFRRGSRLTNASVRLARAERFVDRAAMLIAAGAASAHTGVALDELICPRRRGKPRRASRRPSQARKLALYLAAVALDIPIGRLARSARITHQNVSLWLHEIEDRRDDPAYDAFVARLEAALAGTRR